MTQEDIKSVIEATRDFLVGVAIEAGPSPEAIRQRLRLCDIDEYVIRDLANITDGTTHASESIDTMRYAVKFQYTKYDQSGQQWTGVETTVIAPNAKDAIVMARANLMLRKPKRGHPQYGADCVVRDGWDVSGCRLVFDEEPSR